MRNRKHLREVLSEFIEHIKWPNNSIELKNKSLREGRTIWWTGWTNKGPVRCLLLQFVDTRHKNYK